MDDAHLEDAGVLVIVTVLVDECRNATVGEACHRIAVGDGQVAHDVQVLEWGGAAAEPAIIRDVYHQAGTCADGVSNEVSEDGVVADVWRPVVRSINGRFLSGDKIAFAKVHVIENGENVIEGNALAERHEVLFDVALREVWITRSKEERGVVDFKASRVVHVVRNALVVERSRENA